MMNDADALLEILEARQQLLDRLLVMVRMVLLDLLVRHGQHLCEEILQIAAHIGVRAEVD